MVDSDFDSIYQEIYKVVRLIPEGRVATYGQIARLVGRPRHARQVGYALSALSRLSAHKEADDVPWHRVINSKGEVSARAHPDYENYQKILLEDEGIEFELRERICLHRYQWDA